MITGNKERSKQKRTTLNVCKRIICQATGSTSRRHLLDFIDDSNASYALLVSVAANVLMSDDLSHLVVAMSTSSLP